MVGHRIEVEFYLSAYNMNVFAGVHFWNRIAGEVPKLLGYMAFVSRTGRKLKKSHEIQTSFGKNIT